MPIPDHIALLRGINVGGHRVKMDRLRALFADMGFRGVETFIASGNVIFSSEASDQAALADRIEHGLREGLGYAVPTFMRTPSEVEAVAGYDPRTGHADSPDGSLYVVFLKQPPDDAMRARFTPLESSFDRFVFDGREIYWSMAGKLSASPLFGTGLEKAVGAAPCTLRNITSVRRLVDKVRMRTGDAGSGEPRR
jgi:uncharacterized protein (DUF1697 family)